MKILLTGASSFTGYWFASALSRAGHKIVMPLRGDHGSYQTSPRSDRVAALEQLGEVVWACPFGSKKFLDLIDRSAVDFICHHAAEVKDYRSENFDVLGAVASNSHGLVDVLKAAAGIKGIVLTGSVFEADEGTGNLPLRAFSPYGLSKGLTADIFRYWANKYSIRLGKFVIPNPFGPYEEARFVSYLVNCFLRKEPAKVGTPVYVRDNIHVDLLAACYVTFCEQVGASSKSFLKCNPSGYVENQEAFARRVSREMAKRLGLPCEVFSGVQTDFSEPPMRVNTEIASLMVPSWSEEQAWDQLVAYYNRA